MVVLTHSHPRWKVTAVLCVVKLTFSTAAPFEYLKMTSQDTFSYYYMFYRLCELFQSKSQSELKSTTVQHIQLTASSSAWPVNNVTPTHRSVLELGQEEMLEYFSLKKHIFQSNPEDDPYFRIKTEKARKLYSKDWTKKHDRHLGTMVYSHTHLINQLYCLYYAWTFKEFATLFL